MLLFLHVENLISKACAVSVLSKPFMLDILRDKREDKKKRKCLVFFYFLNSSIIDERERGRGLVGSQIMQFYLLRRAVARL